MTTAVTKYGAVRGELIDGVSRFLGVPYAASPTGPFRFRAPQPPEPWDGVRECLAFSATPPKPDYPAPAAALLPEPNIPGDDWLTVNVWSPDLTAAAPVMVFIHGGAFSNGNSAIPLYDGHAFARDGVVLVTMNYRLGVDGFLQLPGAPPNRGLLDQAAALTWVRDNIAAFGGDPANVTVFGESAGAISVTALLSMPRARGLFAKAITQSGAAQIGATPQDALLVTRELGSALGIEPTAANLADVELPRLIAAQAAVRDALAVAPDPARFGATITASTISVPFVPIIDGDVLPEQPLAAIAAGAGADVPLLAGTNTEELRLFLIPSGVAGLVTDEMLPAILQARGASPDVVPLYRANRPGASAGDLLCAVLTDSFFRLPALAVAEARQSGPAPTYFYEFAWRTPVLELGATHALELPFVFDNLTAPGADLLTGAAPPASLAAAMHAAWIRFATTGDPGWQAFDPSYPVMTWDGKRAEVALDPRGDERRAWART